MTASPPPPGESPDVVKPFRPPAPLADIRNISKEEPALSSGKKLRKQSRDERRWRAPPRLRDEGVRCGSRSWKATPPFDLWEKEVSQQSTGKEKDRSNEVETEQRGKKLISPPNTARPSAAGGHCPIQGPAALS